MRVIRNREGVELLLTTTSPSDRELSVLHTYTAASQLLFTVEGEVPASRA